MQTDNLRITNTYPLITPAVLAQECPLTDRISSTVSTSRETTRAILKGEDERLLVIVGPCSIHDTTAALDYAQRLGVIAKQVEEKLFCIMRVYFEKPRTTVGWKGLINDPRLDESYHINEGLHLARKLLTDIAEAGLPAATEFLDTTLGQYYTDLITWGAIGARTVESQVHRQLASGLSMPVGFKNRTDGDIQVAVDAIRASSSGHLFPSLTKEGTPAILETSGNPDGHLVLRGGALPNYSPQDISRAVDLLIKYDINPRLIVDCSHANSGKDHEKQPLVAKAVAADRKSGQAAIAGIMIESHLEPGRQDPGGKLVYGQSITDACLGIDDTEQLLLDLAASI